MAKVGDNNPRAFGDAVSLDAWRTPFDGTTGEADLHVNVVFSEGRIGDAQGPVRFRLEIIRAEVHVLRDAADILKIKSSSVATLRENGAERTVTQTLEAERQGTADITLASAPTAHVGTSTKHVRKQEVVTKDRGEMLSFLAMRTEQGYAFRISSEGSPLLRGSPWHASEKLLTIRDSGHLRAKGEPPELRIELRCRREDLHITDIDFTETGRSFYDLSANKKLAIEQYIKSELLRVGFAVADISDPFSEVILADVTPEEE